MSDMSYLRLLDLERQAVHAARTGRPMAHLIGSGPPARRRSFAQPPARRTGRPGLLARLRLPQLRPRRRTGQPVARPHPRRA